MTAARTRSTQVPSAPSLADAATRAAASPAGAAA
eukprot:CAMPEP_0206037014 /NCGR_PEP_ID=MMETSP1466-20131121/3176_1 /ASSEMBLY_ACC=CAM_ASM_001126 /TAXON_ID=44452 /ORGANISM="Pavlova gyrans, Strain CCMP608" /LENGTH=33 /DNA_ID= /DNA_START= /DNA_END= /DNA_ORIENTATION=